MQPHQPQQTPALHAVLRLWKAVSSFNLVNISTPFTTNLNALADTLKIPVAIVFYTALAAEFLWRYSSDKPLRSSSSVAIEEGQEPKDTSSNRLHSNMKLQIYGLLLSTLFLFIRAIYRTVEVTLSLDDSDVPVTQFFFFS